MSIFCVCAHFSFIIIAFFNGKIKHIHTAKKNFDDLNHFTFLFLCTFSIYHYKKSSGKAVRNAGCKLIASFVIRVTVMTLDPNKFDLVAFKQR